MSIQFQPTPYYCEENVWQLAREMGPSAMDGEVVFISNTDRLCALWGQRASNREDGLVIWDYHVVFHRSGTIWDLDCRQGAPLPVSAWLAATFPHREEIPPRFLPQFRAVPWPAFESVFSSDRSHMRTPEGDWQAPPPSWPCIGEDRPSNLMEFVDFRLPHRGAVMNLEQIQEAWAALS